MMILDLVIFLSSFDVPYPNNLNRIKIAQNIGKIGMMQIAPLIMMITFSTCALISYALAYTFESISFVLFSLLLSFSD